MAPMRAAGIGVKVEGEEECIVVDVERADMKCAVCFGNCMRTSRGRKEGVDWFAVIMLDVEEKFDG